MFYYVSLTRLGQFEYFTGSYIHLSNFLAEFVQVIKFYRHEHGFSLLVLERSNFARIKNIHINILKLNLIDFIMLYYHI